MAGINVSSTMRNASTNWKKAGFVEYRNKMAAITPQGLDNPDMDVVNTIERPMSNKEKHNTVRESLKPEEVLLFTAMIYGRPTQGT
jgi:hypothetical protein